MMGLNVIIPKKFLFLYDLDIGSFVVGIFMSCIMVLCGIVILAQVLTFKNCEVGGSESYNLWRNAYSLSITAIIYCIFMVAINIWFILLGVKKQKSSVVLGWVVMMAMWLAQTCCLLIVLLIMYLKDVSLVSWILSLIFGLVGMGIPLYGLLIGYGYWLELKNKVPVNTTDPPES